MPDPGSSKDRHKSTKPPRPSTPLEQQAAQLEKLLKDPSKPAYVPPPPSEKKGLRAPVDMMKNVMGSSAGAGSGEFHIYKHSRRREYERLRLMDEADAKVGEQTMTLTGVTSTAADALLATVSRNRRRLGPRQKQRLRPKKPRRRLGQPRTAPSDRRGKTGARTTVKRRSLRTKRTARTRVQRATRVPCQNSRSAAWSPPPRQTLPLAPQSPLNLQAPTIQAVRPAQVHQWLQQYRRTPSPSWTMTRQTASCSHSPSFTRRHILCFIVCTSSTPTSTLAWCCQDALHPGSAVLNISEQACPPTCGCGCIASEASGPLALLLLHLRRAAKRQRSRACVAWPLAAISPCAVLSNLSEPWWPTMCSIER